MRMARESQQTKSLFSTWEEEKKREERKRPDYAWPALLAVGIGQGLMGRVVVNKLIGDGNAAA